MTSVTCRKCGSGSVRVETRNGQDCVWCLACDRYSHNAPRTETGREVRNLRTRPDIKPKQRSRILDRDQAQCFLCHRSDVDLDVGHLVSVDDGCRLGLTEAEMYDDANLAAMCTLCNSGYGAISVNPRLIVASIRACIERDAV